MVGDWREPDTVAACAGSALQLLPATCSRAVERWRRAAAAVSCAGRVGRRIVGAGTDRRAARHSARSAAASGVTLYEAAPIRAKHADESGRSINLALADRGMHALELAGVLDEIAARAGSDARPLRPSTGRLGVPAALRAAAERSHLLDLAAAAESGAARGGAARSPASRLKFEHAWRTRTSTRGTARFEDLRGARRSRFPCGRCSPPTARARSMRRRMAARGLIEVREADLEHGYKELIDPGGRRRSYRMEREALHIWPRGGYMLIALPNEDGSFTATLFLPMQGPVEFREP